MKFENLTPSEALNDAPLKRGSNLSYRILLVDDEPQLRELCAEILIQHGYYADTAENGMVAWNTLNEINYDLLITDNNMPRLTGLQLIKKVRFEGMRLPIILASGTVPTEELSQNSSLRIDAILRKPFFPDELLATIKKVLFASSSAAELFAA